MQENNRSVFRTQSISNERNAKLREKKNRALCTNFPFEALYERKKDEMTETCFGKILGQSKYPVTENDYE